MKKKLYIACALTNLEDDKRNIFLSNIESLKNSFREDFEVLEFLGVDDRGTQHPFTPKEIYEHAIKKCIEQADYVVAICDYPSIGLGYELGVAIEKRGIPVLAFAHKESLVTRLVIGIEHENFAFARYSSLDDIVQTTLKTLTK